MFKHSNVLTIGQQIFLSNIISGILWILCGFCGFLNTTVSSFIQILLFLVIVLLNIVLIHSKREAEDEMSDLHFSKAETVTSFVLSAIFCLIAILTALFSKPLNFINWNWPQVISCVFYILLGLKSLVTGIVFKKLEA